MYAVVLGVVAPQPSIDTDALLAIALVAVTGFAAFAAWRQAKAAGKMEELTRQLADTAGQALEASRRQAEAGDRSLAESQRQAHLAAVPILQVDEPEIEKDKDDEGRIKWFRTKITIRNGTVPALGVRVVLTGAEQKGRVREQSAGAREWPVLTTGESITFRANTGGLDIGGGSFLPSPQREYIETRFFLHDLIEVEVSYRGLLGAEVTQIYEWFPHREFPDETVRWRLRELEVAGEGVPYIRQHFPDEDEEAEIILTKALSSLGKAQADQ